MSLINRSLSAVGKIGIVIGIAVAFLFGLTSTVYLSLRSSTVTVPDVVGKDRLTAENALQDSGLNIRVRATRPTSDAKPDTVLMQVPRAGEMVKEGQTVAVDISRVPKEGEQSISLASTENRSAEQKPDEQKETEISNAKETTQKNDNQNANQNQNKAKRNKNTNSNSNSNANNRNANNANNGNSSTNVNRANANNRNANQGGQNRNANTGNHNANANLNRNSTNTNRRAPANITTQPAPSPGNRRTP